MFVRPSVRSFVRSFVRLFFFFFLCVQVLHWIKVFGSENVLVVDSADLKSKQKETIEVRCIITNSLSRSTDQFTLVI